MTLTTLHQTLDLAERNRQAGNLQEAERLCREVLAQEPHHSDAMHLLGVLAFQTGRRDAAVDFIQRAITANPQRPHYYSNLGLALASTGQFEQAIAMYRRALSMSPNYPEAYNNLGMAFRAQSKLDDAINAYRQALSLRPDSPETLNNLGNALGAKGQWDQAIDSYRTALSLRADYAEAHNNLGYALSARGEAEQAVVSFRRALELNPRAAVTWCNLGNALRQIADWDKSITAQRQAIGLEPELAEAYFGLAAALLEKGQIDESFVAARRALELNPEYARAHNVMGNILQAKSQLDASLASYHKALEIEPEQLVTKVNIGNTLHLKGEYDAAIDIYHKVLAIDPDQPQAHWNLALVSLLRGDFQNGWNEYEWRRKIPEFRPALARLDRPLWDGADPAGQRILLHTEQAFGDTIHFARYIHAVISRGATVCVAAHPKTARLLASISGVDRFSSDADSLPDFDIHCPLPSLPHALKIADPFWSGPYLRADSQLKPKFEPFIAQAAGKLKVGLVWAGGARPPGRSIALSQLAPLAHRDIQFYSLQIGPGREQAQSPPPGMNLIDPTQAIADFADSAALVDELDLLVTIDTAAAQLAGALGKRVWTLLKFVPDWRWLLDRDDSPWYPSMRLFRQETAGDWETPINRLAAELRGLL
jgi:tetratricopeptide (TPR) repeat protein